MATDLIQQGILLAIEKLDFNYCKQYFSYLHHSFLKHLKLGHVRIGPDVCLDESRIISREHEDFVTWRNKSKIRAKLNEYNDERDDYEFEC